MAQSSVRRIACARCGRIFDCGLSANCWCAAEPCRLPMAEAALEDCLCRDCMREAAAAGGRRRGAQETED